MTQLSTLLTLPHPMNRHFQAFLLIVACCLSFPQRSPAPVVFKPDEKKAKYVAPGDEEISGNAQELFLIAQEAEKEGNRMRALRAYRTIVKKYPKDTLAPGSAYRTGQLLEEERDFLRAAGAYRHLVERYPKSPNFDEAIEGQFRIGEMYLSGKKLKILGIPIKVSMDQAVGIFSAIVATAPYGKYTARAQFNIGLARERQQAEEAAIAAYQAVVEKFPADPIAADAQYQIGYIYLTAARTGNKDAKAAANARTGFEDFLFRYPNSEKAAQARENLKQLERKETVDAYKIARFYDKQKNFRAASIYYNDVIRQRPDSTEGDYAKKRVEELRAKFGDSLKPLADVAPAEKMAPKPADGGERPEQASGTPSSLDDVAPLPPPESDASLPPPASLMPDTATESSPTPTPEGTE